MLNEWRFIQRLPIPPSPSSAAMPAIHAILVDLATSHDRRIMFPVFSSAAEKILLLQVGTAGVECSFSSDGKDAQHELYSLLMQDAIAE